MSLLSDIIPVQTRSIIILRKEYEDVVKSIHGSLSRDAERVPREFVVPVAQNDQEMKMILERIQNKANELKQSM